MRQPQNQERIDTIEEAEHLLHPTMEAIQETIWMREAKSVLLTLEKWKDPRVFNISRRLAAVVAFGGPAKYRLGTSGPSPLAYRPRSPEERLAVAA